jgi:DNA-binding HxlR family transcriptional regulator
MSRSYGDPCGIARALDRVGERWALLVVRELLLGAKRFTDLRAGLPHVGPDVLAQRLRELEDAGLVRRAKLPPPAASRVYELTDLGKELEPVILALGRFGSRLPFPDSDMPLGADAMMVALKTVFDPARGDHHDAVIELRLVDQIFCATVAGASLEIVRGGADRPDAIVTGEPPALAAVLWHGQPLEQSSLEIDGDSLAVERFFGMFRTPQPATGTAA